MKGVGGGEGIAAIPWGSKWAKSFGWFANQFVNLDLYDL